MTQIITATFEDGVFKPDGKLNLAAGAKVQLVVSPSPDNKEQAQSEVPQHPVHAGGDALAREQLQARIQREWDESFEQRQQAFAEMERLRIEHPIDTRGERLTRDQLHERR